jgi:hypothetical protein
MSGEAYRAVQDQTHWVSSGWRRRLLWPAWSGETSFFAGLIIGSAVSMAASGRIPALHCAKMEVRKGRCYQFAARRTNGRYLRIAVVMHFGERVSVSRPVA